jgi:hypothetical protein
MIDVRASKRPDPMDLNGVRMAAEHLEYGPCLCTLLAREETRA